MRYIVDVNAEHEKEFLDTMKVLRRLQVVKSLDRKSKKNKAGTSDRPAEREVSSREMANQYRDLVD